MSDWLSSLEVIVGDKESKNAYFLREAYVFGANYSKDQSTKNGAILVRNRKILKNKIIAYGACGLIPEINDLPKRHERPMKYSYLTHAERDVIFQAAKNGISTKDSIMYCPWFACADCGVAIISAGIKKVVGHYEIMQQSPSYWAEKIKPAIEMFDEAGVELLLFSGKIGGVKTIYNQKVWEP